jgi:hypothetical protein
MESSENTEMTTTMGDTKTPSMNIVDSMAEEPTTSVSSTNVDTNVSTPSESLDSAEMSTTSAAVLENTVSTGKVNSVAESPAAKGRSPKQKEADAGAAKILERMRELYNVEFADVPANKRPKPPSWAARAALYKNENEREEYIKEMVQSARNSLSSKNNVGNNSNTGNNADSVYQRLMQEVNTAKTALTAVTQLAKQLKNVTRKGKRASNTSYNNNAAANEPMAYNNNNANNNAGNSYNTDAMNSTMFTQPSRVSPLTARKTSRPKTRSKRQNSMTPMTF